METTPFDTKTEINVLKALNKMLKENPDETTRQKPEEVNGVLDASSCIMVIAKTQDAKRVLSRYTTERKDKEPQLNYINVDNSKARFSVTFITYAMKLMDATSKATHISTKKEYPMTIENEYFSVIIAPRMEDN